MILKSVKLNSLIGLFLTFAPVVIVAQQQDTLLLHNIEPLTIQAYKVNMYDVKSLESVHETYIVSGKKNEVIQIQNLPANIAEKTGRQIFAKVPGAFVYDMDGSGNQVNFSTRGLDPHRSWEYNVRQNGILTNSDMYGYPASHYSPPMEAIQRLEIIRGSGSLQYGAQFGGMINFITKQADTSRVIGIENITSVGSYGLLSNYTSIGGKKGKWTYFGYYHRRKSEGYRANGSSDAQAQFASITYAFSKNIKLRGEIARSQYLYQLPGPLTDAMFKDDPRQSTRTRNHYSPDITVPSLSLDWRITDNTLLQWKSSAIFGDRSSVLFIGFANVSDTINKATGTFNNRQVDIDLFNSYTNELRLQHNYTLFGKKHTLVSGIMMINNDLHRRQQGKGSTGKDFDLSVEGAYIRDIHLKTNNIAVFAENLFRLSPKWELTAGARYENGASNMTGLIQYLPNEDTRKRIEHNFILAGAGFQYQINNKNRIYGNWSQAYRPVIFADIIPGTILEKTDPNLRNAFGHNMEFGIKGRILNTITYDLNFFQVLYKNRIGNLVLVDQNQQSYIWKTNIGDSRTNGIELYLEGTILAADNYKISLFTSSSYFDGKYIKGELRRGNENVKIKGNTIESVPEWISRNGLQAAYKSLSLVLQYSFVSATYSDALNTIIPTANGAAGVVPAYGIWDVNMSLKLAKPFLLRLGVNNMTNVSYFTKRPTIYPGPGVWSSDGLGLVATLSIHI